MDRIPPDLRAEFDRWRKQIPPQPPPEPGKVTIEDALKAHVFLVDAFSRGTGEGVGGIGPKNMMLLASAIDRQNVGLGRASKWNNVFEWTATAFFGMIKNHPFHDGNKRTALLLALWQLYRAKRTPTSSEYDFERLAVHTAAGTLDEYDPRHFADFSRRHDRPDADVLYVADRFRAWTRQEDREIYIVTFTQLDRCLRRFRCRLDNPNKNYIDVIKTVKRRRFLLSWTEADVKVLDIGFPNWKADVGRSTIRKVRVACGLMPEDGIDSKVFFQDLEPMQSLIDRFYEPLRRLADK